MTANNIEKYITMLQQQVAEDTEARNLAAKEENREAMAFYKGRINLAQEIVQELKQFI